MRRVEVPRLRPCLIRRSNVPSEGQCIWRAMGNWDMRKQLNSFTVEQAKSYSERKQTIREWGRWIDGKLDEGWEGYLVTLMYKQIRGRKRPKLRSWGKSLNGCTPLFSRAYCVAPRPSNKEKLPILIAAPDYPFAKRRKFLLKKS